MDEIDSTPPPVEVKAVAAPAEMTIERWAMEARVPVARLNHLRHVGGDKVKTKHTAAEWAAHLDTADKARF